MTTRDRPKGLRRARAEPRLVEIAVGDRGVTRARETHRTDRGKCVRACIRAVEERVVGRGVATRALASGEVREHLALAIGTAEAVLVVIGAT